MDDVKNKFISDISGKEFFTSEMVLGSSIRKSLFELIQNEYPNFTVHSKISILELNVYREKYIADFMFKDKSQLNELEKQVLNTIKKSESISNVLSENDDTKLTFGEKLSDKVAAFGGSWTFILCFLGFMAIWILLNLYSNNGFDPYPFILLNLILSCIASLQAPIIMMSQNRQEAKDRERAQSDYMVNLKSELEIRTLHEKLDHLMIHQQQELIEIQKVQIDILNDIVAKLKRD